MGKEGWELLLKILGDLNDQQRKILKVVNKHTYALWLLLFWNTFISACVLYLMVKT